MIWWPRQTPNMGYFPRSARTSATTGAASEGSPGPLERKIPSGRSASTVSAAVSQGRAITVQPRAFMRRTRFCFMPQSTAATRNFSSAAG